ncbi:MAG: MotA/TolQ/ExbB proton channel family protein [Prevotella sp.]|nr:MotA/TolQ/ExbB proton channel family protein [Prevotella sp.]MDD3387551.1 MotA/TolQ/ExbB proton channel family protein [Prevotella sp.]MDD4534488.1 MotA/TolQ/ExbB proton channel family protein [Prevotella sp.]
MATTQKAAAPKAVKKSQGFTGIRGAFWILVVCFIAAELFYSLVLGNTANFQGNDNANAPINMLGTIFKGGVIVPIIHTLLLTVLCLSVERWLALKTAFGKGSLTKFVANIKASLKANDFAKAEELCNKMQGSVANVVIASLRTYKEMDNGANTNLKKSQKVARIQQAHEEATQLEMPTLQMNLPIVATIVTLGTLTGLLGTVTGMIRSFSALAAGGGGDSLALSTGISEALINTAFGIATSWCAVISYNYFTNKIDKLTYALDEVGYSIAQTYEANHTDEA